MGKKRILFLKEVARSGVELSSAPREAHEVLKRARKSICLGYDVLIHWLLQAVQQPGKEFYEEVQALICDPPINTPQIVEISNLGHNQLILQPTSHFVEFLSALMDAVGHGRLFWVEDVVREEDAVKKEEMQSERKTVSNVEGKVMHYL